ncbi:MAG TPA: ATP-binding protein [Ktedonobacterales bacterium]
MKGADDLVVLVNADGVITYASPAILPMLGYTPEAVMGSPLSALAHPDDADALRRMLGAPGQTPRKNSKTFYRLRAKDGAICRARGDATNLLQAPGVGAIVVHFHQAPQRQRAPRSNGRRTRSSEHFVQFYESDAFLLHALREFVETGLNAGEACIVVATQAHLEQLEARLQAGGQDLLAAQMQHAYLPLDAGETLDQFMVDGSPEPTRFHALLEPLITRAAQHQRHVRVFGEMVALLWTAGNQPAAIRLEALWNDLARGTTPFSLFCAYPMPDLAGTENEAPFNEICHQHARVIPAESYAALSGPDERLRAISELQQKASSLQAEIAGRKAAEERAAAQAHLLALEEATRQMEAFVGIVSHELRTPVTALKSSIQLARRRIAQAADGGEEQHSGTAALLERTDTQMRRLTRLIDDLVDLARIRSGKLEMRVTVCDLGQVVHEQVESACLIHTNRLIHFEPPREPLLVRGDPDRLGQVVLNYLTNALKYAPAARPITIDIQQQGLKVQVRVRDQGPGIPADEQAHIWEVFHRVPGIEAQNGSGIGLGLGLHISKVMIERQGGQVGVESMPGQGSTFWFALPLASPQAS